MSVEDQAIVAKSAGEIAADHGAGGEQPLVGRRPDNDAEWRHQRRVLDAQMGRVDPAVVRLDERDVAAELGAIDPAAVPSIDRPDGRPGFTEQYAGAELGEHASSGVEIGDAIRPPVNEKLRTPPPRRNPISAGILTTADHVIHSDRAQAYGPAEDSFSRIAALWSVHLGIDVDAYDVSILMVLMKVARAKTDLKDDTFVDIAGYAALAPRLAAHVGRQGA